MESRENSSGFFTSTYPRKRLALLAAILLLVTPTLLVAREDRTQALSISQGEFKLDVEIAMTSTASPDWQAVPGSSPGLRLFVHNFGLPAKVQQCQSDPDPFTCERSYMRSADSKANTITFVIEPGYSPDTDFEIASGTALPDGFVFAGRGGKPGDPSQNPVNLSGNPDAGTATVRVCIDAWNGGIPEYTWNAQCTWARQQEPTDQFPLGGEGACPGWLPGEGGIQGTEPLEGPAHIVTITNDAGPYEVPGLGVHPNGRLYDRRRERWAYARWSVLACAGVNITNILNQQLGLGAAVYLEAFVYRDDPYPGAYSLILYQGEDERTGIATRDMDGNGLRDNYKDCGFLLNPCFSIFGVGLAIDTFSSSHRVATVPKVCGRYQYTVRAADDVTSPGHTYIEGSDGIPTAGYPNCPSGIRGIVAGSNGRPLDGAVVRAFDASTGQYVNSGFGWDSIPCRGGQIPYDGPSGVPQGPGPGGHPSSWGCDTTIGNTGYGLHLTPGWGDGRWYIRTNTGSGSYKVLITSPPHDGNVSRWATPNPPASGTNDWNTAYSWSTADGPQPAIVGDMSGSSVDLTSTLSAGLPVEGRVLKNGTWITGADQGWVGLWNCAGSQFEATPTYVFSDGTFSVDTPSSCVKAKFSVRTTPAAPDMVGWYSGSATPATSFGDGANISVSSPGATLVDTNFASYGELSSRVVDSGGSGIPSAEVSIYKASTGTLAAVTSTGNDGSWRVGVPTTLASGNQYKVFVRPPTSTGLAPAWYSLKSSFTDADSYSSPASIPQMALPSAKSVTGYVKAQGTDADMAEAADIDNAVVYAYNASTGALAGWAKSGVQASGRYKLDLPAGNYKLLTYSGTSTRENAFWSGAWSYAEASPVAVPATANFSLRPAGLIQGALASSGSLVYGYTDDGSHFAGWTGDLGGAAYALKVPKTTASGYSYKLKFVSPVSGYCFYTGSSGGTPSFSAAAPVSAPASGINDCWIP